MAAERIRCGAAPTQHTPTMFPYLRLFVLPPMLPYCITVIPNVDNYRCYLHSGLPDLLSSMEYMRHVSVIWNIIVLTEVCAVNTLNVVCGYIERSVGRRSRSAPTHLLSVCFTRNVSIISNYADCEWV